MSWFEHLAGVALFTLAIVGLLAATNWLLFPKPLDDDDDVHGDTTGWKGDK